MDYDGGAREATDAHSGNEQAIFIPMEGLEGETSDLPLHFASGGSEVRVRGVGEGEVSCDYADDGELFRLPGAELLPHVEPRAPAS
jgi:hypothetical protein